VTAGTFVPRSDRVGTKRITAVVSFHAAIAFSFSTCSAAIGRAYSGGIGP